MHEKLYAEKASLKFLEDSDEMEYGEEVFNELFCKTPAQQLTEYRQNEGTVHLKTDKKFSAVMAIVQCLLQCSPLIEHVITHHPEKTNELIITNAIRRITAFAYRRKHLGPKDELDIEFLTS